MMMAWPSVVLCPVQGLCLRLHGTQLAMEWLPVEERTTWPSYGRYLASLGNGSQTVVMDRYVAQSEAKPSWARFFMLFHAVDVICKSLSATDIACN